MPTPLKIAIIGAGPAGLTCGLALARRGIDITIAERGDNHLEAATYNPNRSYTIDITGHGKKAADHVGATKRFDQELIRFRGIKYALPAWTNRAPNKTMTEAYPGQGWTGSRGDICRALQTELNQVKLPNTRLLFSTEAHLTDASKGILFLESSDNKISHEETFDMIIGCDGGGSATRSSLQQLDPSFSVSSMDLGNHSIMLHLDQHLDELNPEYLYVHAVRPVAAITGAVNGPNGPKDPRWFCQLGFSGFRSFSSTDEAEKFLLQTQPLLLRYASPARIAEFSQRDCLATGKSKRCSSLVSGRVVLLGDAGAPVPPIGQGVNAAMESAMVLDQCLALAQEQGSGPDAIVAQAQAHFLARWTPEADALREIALTVDLSKSYTSKRLLLASVLGYSGVANAKKEELSYQEAWIQFRTWERRLRYSPLRWLIPG
jgi:kynurenine 3-monooxygenase|uniref:FAD-dependent oxidoreductase n=1 Tax=Cyanobium sp. TaxID=2164130 RepID=UPI004049436D